MNLNDQQAAVVNSTAQRILCLAGAGAGKTRTMIERIRKLVSDGVKPDSILVLTFTNAAATEMRCRYGTEDSILPEFRTFHSFCYNLIGTDEVVRKRIGYEMVPSIIDEIQYKRIKASILTELSLKIPVKVLEGIQQPTLKQKSDLKFFDIKLRKYLIQHSLITFDILCYDICKLFEDGDQTIFPYKVKYKYIFVDEFQDTDPKQWQFVSSFKDANLFVTGDKNQSIYKFRGADSSIIKALAKDPDWNTYRLEHNYRSAQEIVKFANKISSTASEESYHINMKSDISGGVVNQVHQESDRYIDDIISLIKSFKGSTAILARTNSEVYDLQNKLSNEGITFDRNTKDKHVEYVLRSIVDDNFCAEYLASLLDTEGYLKYIRNLFIDKPTDTLSYLLTKHSNEFVRYIYGNISKLKEGVQHRIESESPVRACIWLIRQFYFKYNNVPKCDNTVTSIVNTAITELNDLSKDDADVYIGTIHSVKGLEYDNVVVTGVGSINFRLKDEEMTNLFYVACTRAKHELDIFVDDYDIPESLKPIFMPILNSYINYNDYTY